MFRKRGWSYTSVALRFVEPESLPVHHMALSYTCCAQFLVTREAIRARPKAMYDALYAYSLGGADFGQRGGSFARGECLEALWHVLFGQPRVVPPASAWRKCGRGLQARHCAAESALLSFVPQNDSFWSFVRPTWLKLGVAQRSEVRSGRVSIYEAAVRSGELCFMPEGAETSSVRGASHACVGTDPVAVARAVDRMKTRLVSARVRALGSGIRLLSTNCTLLWQQSAASVSRRKLSETLRQHCATVLPTALSSKFPLPRHKKRQLHHDAMCALFQAEAFAAHLPRRKHTRLSAADRHARQRYGSSSKP